MAPRTFSTDNREKLAEEGKALNDGSYPIPDKGALRRAIQSIGRAGPKGSTRYELVKKHCIKMAKELDATDLLPDDWKEELQMSDLENIEIEVPDDFLEHFGKKGMKWGVRTQTPTLIKENRAKGLSPNKMRSENQRIDAAGGGVRGTFKVRKEMIDSGELSKTDARKGTARFGRNVTAALLVGSLAGVTIAGLTKRKGHDYSRLGESKIMNTLAKKIVLGE